MFLKKNEPNGNKLLVKYKSLLNKMKRLKVESRLHPLLKPLKVEVTKLTANEDIQKLRKLFENKCRPSQRKQ